MAWQQSSLMRSNGTFFGTDARVVLDPQSLHLSRQLGVNARHVFVYLPDHLLAPDEQICSMLNQALVPEEKLRGITASASERFQQGVPLRDNVAIALKLTAILAIDLANDIVQVTASQTRRARCQLDVFGQEKHCIELAYDIHCPLASAVQADVLAHAR